MQQTAGDLGRFIKPGVTHGVGQSGIGIATDVGVGGDFGQNLDVRPHQGGAQCAIESDGQWLGVAHAVPKRGHGLAAQYPARGVGDGTADDQRQSLAAVFEIFVYREQRRLGVERVKNGFQQQHIHTTFHQCAHLRQISQTQFFKVNIARTGVVHVGADAGGFGCGTKCAHGKTGLVRGGVFVARGAGDRG